MVDFPSTPETLKDILILVVRVVVAVAFLASARSKFKNIKKFAKGHDLPVPVATLLAIAEAAGALGVLSGVLGQWAAAGLALIMLSTISLHVFKWHSSYWASEGGWEYDLSLLLFCLILIVFGIGKFVVLA